MPIPAGYHEAIVTPERSRNIEAVWSYVATSAGQSVILPDGRCDIILRFNTQINAPPVPIMTGPGTRPYLVPFKPGDAWVGLRLRPTHGATLWAHRIVTAREQVLQGQRVAYLFPELGCTSKAEPSVADMRAALTSIPGLVAPEPTPDTVNRAVELVHLSGGRIRTKALASYTGCSTRQLNRLFSGSVGLPAKVYADLVQFHRSLGLIRNDGLALADAAFEAGYADQAHMARAMRRYGGFSPSNIPKDLSVPGVFG